MSLELYKGKLRHIVRKDFKLNMLDWNVKHTSSGVNNKTFYMDGYMLETRTSRKKNISHIRNITKDTEFVIPKGTNYLIINTPDFDISTFPLLPNSVEFIELGACKFINFPYKFSKKLREIKWVCKSDSLPDLRYLKKLHYITLTGSRIISLENVLPDSVKVLFCDYTKLEKLPSKLPENLSWGDFIGTRITNFPDIRYLKNLVFITFHKCPIIRRSNAILDKKVTLRIPAVEEGRKNFKEIFGYSKTSKVASKSSKASRKSSKASK